MNTYTIWIDDGKHGPEDGEEYRAELAVSAVRAFAWDRLCTLQHVDPGRVVVRYPDGTRERWTMATEMLVHVRCVGPAVDDD